MSLPQVALLVYGALSAASFGLYGYDKMQARRGGRRVPELRLHTLALLGGFPGAYLGMQVFHHKTLRPLFHVLVFAAAMLHALAWVYVLTR